MLPHDKSVGGMYVFMLFAMLVNWYKRDVGSIRSIRKKAGTLIAPYGSRTWNHLNLVSLTNLGPGCV